MTDRIPTDEIQYSGDPAFQYAMMRRVVEAVREEGDLYMPLLNLVTTFIDGLAKGEPGKTKPAYIEYLKKHFPDLCEAVGAETFYEKYRCGAVHEFSLKEGFFIEHDRRMKGRYALHTEEEGSGRQMFLLNIDRLVQDFLIHIRSLEAVLKNPGTGRETT